MIGNSAVPMILMAFGMSLHGTKPLQDKANIPAVFTVAALKNIVMPIIAFLLSYFVMASAAQRCTRAWCSRPADRAERVQLRGPVQCGSIVRTRRYPVLHAFLADFIAIIAVLLG